MCKIKVYINHPYAFYVFAYKNWFLGTNKKVRVEGKFKISRGKTNAAYSTDCSANVVEI